MSPVDLTTLYEAVRTNDSITIRKAIANIGSSVDQLEPRQIPETVEVLSSLFYIDLGDHPEYVSVVQDTVAMIASIGEPAVPTLMWLLGESDYKANLLIARTLGRIGPPAYGNLRDLYYRASFPWQRSLALFALAKMHEAALMEILPDVVTALDDSDREVRDTATRTLGRIIDAFHPGQLPHDIVSNAFERLLLRLHDNSAVVRAKAVRSIGKMASKEYLEHEQLELAVESINELLGLENGEPDPFYIVRKEAEEAMAHLKEVAAS